MVKMITSFSNCQILMKTLWLMKVILSVLDSMIKDNSQEEIWIAVWARLNSLIKGTALSLSMVMLNH